MVPRKHIGQSLPEYAIIGALITLVALPGLLALSGSTQSMLQNMLASPGTGQPNPANSANPNPPVNPNQNPVNPAGQNSDGNSSTTSLVTVDPERGIITIPLNGGGTATASVSGITNEIANQLTILAESWKDEEGNPLPDNLRDRILQLARSTEDLAIRQANIQSMTGDVVPTDPNDPSRPEYKQLFYEGYQVRDDLQSALTLIDQTMGHGNQAQYQQLKDLLSQYTGVAASVSYHLYLKEFPDPEVVAQGAYLQEVGQPVDVSGLNRRQGNRASRESADHIEEQADPGSG